MPGRVADIPGCPAVLRAELAEIAGSRPSSCRDSRSGAAARRAASSRGRPTARSGRGPASPARSASNFRCLSNSTVATSAMPIGMPGMAGLRLLDRVHRQHPQRGGPASSGRDGAGGVRKCSRGRPFLRARAPVAAGAGTAMITAAPSQAVTPPSGGRGGQAALAALRLHHGATRGTARSACGTRGRNRFRRPWRWRLPAHRCAP